MRLGVFGTKAQRDRAGSRRRRGQGQQGLAHAEPIRRRELAID
jgi:hypothetical protein